MSYQVLTVSQLNNYIKSVMDGDPNLNNVFIEGEISNFKNHYSSGHYYFSLKDEEAVVKCVMFRTAAQRLKFKPEDTMRVICVGRVSCYPRDGQYQIYAEDMQPTGVGALAIAYEQLKRKLTDEGLFDINNKRPLPSSPKRIAVVTSETGAALQDIISVVSRRNPGVTIIVCPVIVQGESAPASMCDALEKIYSTDGIDLIILGRGGGSYEDLYCFNDESLVRKIYESPIPVISAVGHETDFTLCDFVADLRAPTPSAAAELAVPDVSKLLERIQYYIERLTESVHWKLNLEFERFDRCALSNVFENPKKIFEAKINNYYSLMQRFKFAATTSLTSTESEFSNLVSRLETLNPASVLARGYSLVKREKTIITDVAQLDVGGKVEITLNKGSAICEVLEIKGDK